MASNKKADIKLNAKHQGKEFHNSFHFVGQVKPVRKKDDATDSWFDVEIFDQNTTQTGKQRRVLQFNIETAFKNELKVELAGMEKQLAYLWSSKDRKSQAIAWNDRLDKTKYPNETYHLIDTEWDKAEKLGAIVKEGMWVDVRGHYELSTFTNDEGKTMNSRKRIIDQLTPLKNFEVLISGLKKGDTFKAYRDEFGVDYIGMGKANEDGVATIRVGWLDEEGGDIYVTKVVNDENGTLSKVTYTGKETVVNERITVRFTEESSIRVQKPDGYGFEYKTYVRNFKSEDFVEMNTFEMQLGIKSTYQDEKTMDTKVNAVYLGYGKEASVPYDVELDVYYKEAGEGVKPFADAFANLNRLDVMVVEGIDNNRSLTEQIEIREDDDNPFAEVAEKVIAYETVTTGTRKGLEILKYVQGTYKKELLTEEEILPPVDNDDPFANTNTGTKSNEKIQQEVQEISEDDLPF